jgi:hypothetical protein
LLLFLFSRLSSALLTIFHRALEIPNRVAQAFAQIAQLARTKENQCNDEYDEKFGYTKFSTKHFLCSILDRAPGEERSVGFWVTFMEIVGQPIRGVKGTLIIKGFIPIKVKFFNKSL